MAYALATSFAGEALLSGFNWFDGADPSHGFVSYQSRPNAEAKGLFSVDEKTGVVRLGVDSTNTYPVGGEGRPSIRLESKAAFNQGLFIADFLHMPPSQCGLWPAFWSYGPNWPAGGEIDIIEGANDQYRNVFSAHTSPGCQITSPRSQYTGNQRSTNCDIGTDNVGCGYDSPAEDASAYGDGFNAAHGGVYAMEWDSEFIKIWHFARDQIPADIANKQPDPANWGLPDAAFGGPSCNVDNFFKDMNLVININFCGDWGNAIWGKTDGCSKYAATCSDFVGSNPEAFANAYWDVRYIDAYQKNSAERESPTPSRESSARSTSTRTETITVSPRESSTVPSSAFSAPKNPLKVDESALLGCYGSSNGFQTFRKLQSSDDMTVERCVSLCKGSKFAGLFETQCFCADSLDANTRTVSGKDGVCDLPCPGDRRQHCGGLAKMARKSANSTAAAEPLSSSSSPARNTTSPPTRFYWDSASPPSGNSTGPVFANSTRKRFQPQPRHQRQRQRQHRRRDSKPVNMLLTVYGAVQNEPGPPLPPPMAPGNNVTYPALTSIVTSTVTDTVQCSSCAGAANPTSESVYEHGTIVTQIVRPAVVMTEDCATGTALTLAPAPPTSVADRFYAPIVSPSIMPAQPSNSSSPSPSPPIMYYTAGADGLWSELNGSLMLGLAVVVVVALLL